MRTSCGSVEEREWTQAIFDGPGGPKEGSRCDFVWKSSPAKRASCQGQSNSSRSRLEVVHRIQRLRGAGHKLSAREHFSHAQWGTPRRTHKCSPQKMNQCLYMCHNPGSPVSYYSRPGKKGLPYSLSCLSSLFRPRRAGGCTVFRKG